MLCTALPPRRRFRISATTAVVLNADREQSVVAVVNDLDGGYESTTNRDRDLLSPKGVDRKRVVIAQGHLELELLTHSTPPTSNEATHLCCPRSDESVSPSFELLNAVSRMTAQNGSQLWLRYLD